MGSCGYCGGITDIKMTRPGCGRRVRAGMSPAGLRESRVSGVPTRAPCPAVFPSAQGACTVPPLSNAGDSLRGYEKQARSLRKHRCGLGPLCQSAAFLQSPEMSPLLAQPGRKRPRHCLFSPGVMPAEPPESERGIHLDLPLSQKKTQHK